jgi:hypothetical protein
MTISDENYFNQGFYEGGYAIYPQITFKIKTFDEIEFNNPTYLMDLSGNTEVALLDEPFKYEKLSDVTSLNLLDHFSFPSKDELYSFMYEEYTMELFGHAPSTEMMTFNILNYIYHNLRDK